MERKSFIKSGLTALGFAAIAPLANSCRKDASDATTYSSSASASTGGTSSTAAGGCTATSSETAGPYLLMHLPRTCAVTLWTARQVCH